MTVTVSNLIQGPGTLYVGTYSATGAQEPSSSAINTTPASSAWTDLGATQDGVNFEIAREFSELAVDQIIDTPDRRQTKREFGFSTNLAEVTLENLARASNEATANVTSGSGYKEYLPDDNPFMPVYIATLFDGYAPGAYRRRVIGRRMLSTDPIPMVNKKDGQQLFAVKFMSHYVSSSTRPFRIVDQTA